MDIESIINEIYNEYTKLNLEDKIAFFGHCAPWEQQGLFAKLNETERKELIINLSQTDKQNFIRNLSNDYIEEAFISINDKQSKISFCEALSQEQIKALYKKLDSQEQKDILLDILKELHLNLDERKNNLSEEIISSYNTITESSNSITRSNENIVDYKNQIVENKKQLKDIEKQIKKLDKEREKRLKRQLKASKPRKIDRIAIIAKYRTRKLEQRTEELNQTISELNSKIREKNNTEIKIDDLSNHIEQERTNIALMQERIKESNERIVTNKKTISNIEVKIKKLSKNEKKLLGRKLHQQRLQEINKVLVGKKRTKRDIEPEIPKQEEPIIMPSVEIELEPEQTQENINQSNVTNNNNAQNNNIEKATQDMIHLFEIMEQTGLSFLPNTTPIKPEEGAHLTENPIAEINNKQQQIATYAMGLIAMQLYQNYQQQMANQVQETQSRSRTPGFVNLPLLLSIILFIFSLVLFIIK